MFATKKSHALFAALAMAAIFVTPGTANAVPGDVGTLKVLNTSPLWADSGASYHACNAVNVTTGAVSVKIDLLNSSGVVMQTATQSVAAGTSVEVMNGTTYSGFARCRFSVSNPDYIRANITVFRWAGSYYESLAIDSAR